VKIVNSQGFLVKQIANNETLGTNGFFRWDGDQEGGSKARVGYYFVWFQVYDTNGKVQTLKKRVVVAAQF
jgi:flagellar hook assembly protein FlgD